MFNIKKNKKGKGRGVVIQTVVPKEVNEQLKKVCKDSGLHKSSLIRLIIMQHLNSPKDDRLHEVNKLAEIMSSGGGEILDSLEALDNTLVPGILLLRCPGALLTGFSFARQSIAGPIGWRKALRP